MKYALVLLALIPLCTPSPLRAEDPPVCTFGMGALPADTLPAGTPHGSQIPVDTIVVLMQENRSYDHYFGNLRKPNSERAPKDASNPDPTNPSGPAIARFHTDLLCEVADLDHSWNGTHGEWNNGAM